MPEGPSIVILKNATLQFKGKKVKSATGSETPVTQRIRGKKITDIRSWGKHYLLCFSGFTIRIHFLLFGSYTINDRKVNAKPRLQLLFTGGELNFYACNIAVLEGEISQHYDWETDVMGKDWNAKNALEKMQLNPKNLICDVLLNQQIFSGVGNIIKNEVLYRTKVNPKSALGAMPITTLKSIIKEARIYSFQFLEWKQNNELKRHWRAYAQKQCCRCELKMQKKILGKTKRQTFYCDNCQRLYSLKSKSRKI